MTLTAAVLAAGGGRRFGAPKLLMPAGPGEVLLTRAVQLALAVAARVIVVLPGEDPLHRQALASVATGRLTLVGNPDAAKGMGASLALAARALAEDPGDLLVLPADLPLLDPEDLRRLISARGSPGCTASAARDAAGRAQAPAVLGPALLPELRALDADEGARRVLRRSGAQVALVPVAGADEDVDGFDAYRRIALRCAWDLEPPPAVGWRDSLQGRALHALRADHWRIGSSIVARQTGEEPGMAGFRGPGLPRGVRRVLFGGEAVADRLQLLRAAALLSLRDESG